MAASEPNPPDLDPAQVLEITNIQIHAQQTWRTVHKLYVSFAVGDTTQDTRAIPARGAHARWDDVISFDSASDSLSVSLKSKRRLWHPDARVGGCEADVRALLQGSPRQHVARDLDGDPAHRIRIEFDVAVRSLSAFAGATAAGAADAADAMRAMPLPSPPAAAAALLAGVPADAVQSVLDKLAILGQVAGVLSEIHPWAKMAYGVFSAAYKVLRQGAERDAKVRDLLSAIAKALGFADDARALPDRFAHQKGVIVKMLQQAVECGHFVQVYAKDKHFFARAWKQALRDTDRMIDEFTTKFQDLYADFRNNGILQTQLLCIRSKDDLAGIRDAIEVRDIPYAPGAGCQPSKTCLPGTREGLLSDIAQWVNGGGGGGSDKRVLLLTGGAGTGKSTVAHTVARWFRDLGRLGSSFCFSRAEAAARGPSALFGTVARDLADHVPRVRERLSTLDTAARTTRDIADQFEQFLLKPTSGLDILGPIVIVVDALDESGDVFARRPILDIFANKSHLLPSNFRIILTSRPEQDIMAAFKHSAHVERRSMEDVRDTHQDILLYIKTQLTPGLQESDCEELAGLAGRLFQWAFVACKFITDPKPAGINYQARFHRIVPDASRKSTQTLYGLYKTVLTELFVINGMDTDEQENITRNFHSAVGPVLASHRPLSMMSLAVLLSPFGTRESIASTLGDIQCVLEFMGSLLDGVTAGTDTPIQPLHKSFYDFLTSQESAGMFFIDLPYHHGRLCQGSLFIINTHLRFNHCKLKTSHKRNVDQEYQQPSAEIAYACQFFGSHLEQFWRSQHTSIRPPQLTHMVDDFLKKKLLCWFEILSILGRVNVARQTLLQVAKWIEPYHPGLADLAQDAAQFILYFAKPITESAPHIYLSAIPFAPEASLVAQHYQASVLNTLQVEVGKLKNWPAQQLVIQGHKSGVQSAAISHDGMHIISGSNDNTIRMWDALTGEAVGEPLRGHEFPVRSVAFSPDDRHIASGSNDKTIRLWNAQTGEAVGEPLRGHEYSVQSVAFSPDGKHIVSGSDDSTVRVWDAQTGQAMGEPLRGHGYSVRSVAFSPDSKHIVSGSDDNTIQVWDACTGQAVGDPLKGHKASVRSVAFSPDGKHLVSGSSDKTIRLWDAETGEEIGEPLRGHESSVSSVAFSPDGKTIVSGSHDKTIRLWDAQTGDAVGEPLRGHKYSVQSVAFSPDGKHILSASDDSTVWVWDGLTQPTPDAHSRCHEGSVNSVAVSPNGKHIVSGSNDKTIRLWDAQTGEAVGEPLRGHKSSVRSVVFSPQGKHIVSGSNDKTIRVWDAQTGQALGQPLEAHGSWVNTVAFSPDGKHIISAANDNTIRVWDAITQQELGEPLKGHECSVNFVAFSPDGKHIVSGTNDKAIMVWDALTGKAMGMPLTGHEYYSRSVAFSPDGQHIVSGSDDKTITLWDAHTGKPIGDPLKGHNDCITAVAFSPDGKYIVSGSDDCTLRVWDTLTGQAVGEPLRGHESSVNSVVFSPDGKHIISGSYDKTIRIWEIQAGNTTLPGDEYSEQFRSTSIHDDGWLISPQGDLHFWIPPLHLKGFFRAANTAVICEHPTRVAFKQFVHGEIWERCVSFA